MGVCTRSKRLDQNHWAKFDRDSVLVETPKMKKPR